MQKLFMTPTRNENVRLAFIFLSFASPSNAKSKERWAFREEHSKFHFVSSEKTPTSSEIEREKLDLAALFMAFSVIYGIVSIKKT